jgi:hypothetical protein
VVTWLAGGAVPEERGLALVGDAHGRNVGGLELELLEGLGGEPASSKRIAREEVVPWSRARM